MCRSSALPRRSLARPIDNCPIAILPIATAPIASAPNASAPKRAVAPMASAPSLRNAGGVRVLVVGTRFEPVVGIPLSSLMLFSAVAAASTSGLTVGYVNKPSGANFWCLTSAGNLPTHFGHESAHTGSVLRRFEFCPTLAQSKSGFWENRGRNCPPFFLQSTAIFHCLRTRAQLRRATTVFANTTSRRPRVR